MEITEKKIVNVLTNIMTRLDDLEFAQHQHKEMDELEIEFMDSIVGES